jgi:hypothetical protein
MAQSTETSDSSVTSSFINQAGLSSALLEPLEQLTFESPADTVLQRAFSFNSVFSTISSFAKTQQQAVEDDICRTSNLSVKVYVVQYVSR